MSLVISIAETLQIIYEYVPKELILIILTSLVMFIFLEIGDRKREKKWQRELELNKPKSVRGRKSKRD